jgi:hypothetical protein
MLQLGRRVADKSMVCDLPIARSLSPSQMLCFPPTCPSVTSFSQQHECGRRAKIIILSGAHTLTDAQVYPKLPNLLTKMTLTTATCPPRLNGWPSRKAPHDFFPLHHHDHGPWTLGAAAKDVLFIFGSVSQHLHTGKVGAISAASHHLGYTTHGAIILQQSEIEIPTYPEQRGE